jgi:hypothetical protein
MIKFKKPAFPDMDRFTWVSLALFVVVASVAAGARLLAERPAGDPMLEGVDLAREAALFDAGESLGLCYTDGLVARIRNASKLADTGAVQTLITQGEALCDARKDALGKAAFYASVAEAVLKAGDMVRGEELYRNLLKLAETPLPRGDAAVAVMKGYRAVALKGIATIYANAATVLKEQGKQADAARYEAAAQQTRNRIEQAQ